MHPRLVTSFTRTNERTFVYAGEYFILSCAFFPTPRKSPRRFEEQTSDLVCSSCCERSPEITVVGRSVFKSSYLNRTIERYTRPLRTRRNRDGASTFARPMLHVNELRPVCFYSANCRVRSFSGGSRDDLVYVEATRTTALRIQRTVNCVIVNAPFL